MDRLIQGFDAERNADLMICESHGVAYQADMAAGRLSYGADYLAKVEAYEGSDIANAVNVGRCALLARRLPLGAKLLDLGAGSGAFLRGAMAAGFDAKGFDVIPQAAERLRAAGAYAEDPNGFDAVTLWDTLEHMEDPELCLRGVRKGAFLFASLPVFENLRRIRESKHYRPGEHLYYWTARGFVAWMALYGFRLIERSAHETDAGRENIGAFAFCRDLLLCKCGGEMQLECFRWPRKPPEWFMRCRICQSRGPSTADSDEARSLWDAQCKVAA